MAQNIVKFGADTKAYSKGINSMRDQTKKFASGVKGMIGGAFAVTAIVASMKNLFGEMDRIHKLSLRYGMGAAAIQKLGFAAEQNGTTLEVMAKGLAQANRAAVEAGNGLKTYQRAFDDLAISWETFAELGQEEQLHMIADAFKNAEDKNKALAAAQTLLGRAGLELVPMLQKGSEGIKALTADLKTFTDAEVAAAAKVNDSLNKAFTQIKTTLGSVLIEAMNVFKMLAAGGAQAAVEIGNNWSVTGKVIKKALTGDFKGAIAEVENLMDQMGGAAGRIGDAMDDEVRDQVGGPDLGEDKAGAAQAEAELEITKEKQKVLDKIAAIDARIAEEQRKRDEAAMTAAQKLEAAAERRLALEEELSNIDPFQKSEERSNKILEIEKAKTEEAGIQKEIEKEKSESNQKIAEMMADAAKAATDITKDLADIDAAIASERDERSEIGMTEEQILARRQAKERAMVQDLAKIRANFAQDGLTGEEDKDLAARELELEQLRTEIRGMQQGIQDAVPEADGAPQTSIISSSLAAIGGGGGAAMFTADPMLSETKKQTTILESINRRLQPAGGGDRPIGEFPEL